MTWALAHGGVAAHDFHDAHFYPDGRRAPPGAPGAIHRLESKCQRAYRDPGPMPSPKGYKNCTACEAPDPQASPTTTLEP